MHPITGIEAVLQWFAERYSSSESEQIRSAVNANTRLLKAWRTNPANARPLASDKHLWCLLGAMYGNAILAQAQAVYRQATAHYQRWLNRRRNLQTVEVRLQGDLARFGEQHPRTQRTLAQLQRLHQELLAA